MWVLRFRENFNGIDRVRGGMAAVLRGLGLCDWWEMGVGERFTRSWVRLGSRVSRILRNGIILVDSSLFLHLRQ